jgi:soluble lytic murein transglycosylase-like protein
MTGKTTGPHLHFALYTKSGKAIDPTPYLKAGQLPDSLSLATPTSVSNADTTAWLPSSQVLARFDAVSAKIPYASEIRSAAIANGIDPLLLAALASNESSFHATSVSSAGAKGLTQLMPGVASAMGVSNPFDPQQNLNGGAKYLALQLKRFGTIDKALAAYSRGPGTVWRAGGAVPASAKPYVNHVIGKWKRYEESAT